MNNPPLKSGEVGEGVRRLQAALVQVGYPLPRSTRRDHSLDGDFGPETAQAVRRLQTDFNLSRDAGKAGREVMALLDHLLLNPAANPHRQTGESVDRRPSVLDCAILSEDIYSEECRLGAEHGWRRINANRQGGFAAGLYERAGSRVIAFRGSDDRQDAWTDLTMVPVLGRGVGRQAVQEVLRNFYVQRDNPISEAASELLETLTQTSGVRHAVQGAANQRAVGQTTLALGYFDGRGSGVPLVTGHSLGGALAQAVSQDRQVQAVCFNSPYMGGLRGTVSETSTNILYVNAERDPCSTATRVATSERLPDGTTRALSHGRTITIPTSPPTNVGQTVPEGARRWLQQQLDDLFLGGGVTESLLLYLVGSMMYYHDMTNLRRAVARQGWLQTLITEGFSNVVEPR